MKIILFIILVVLVACKSKQENTVSKEIISLKTFKNPNYKTLKEFNGDTLKYLNTFVTYQDYYKGKPLDILLDDLELSINYYHFTSSARNVNLIPALGFSTNKRNQVNKKILKKENPLLFYVTWEAPLSSNKCNELLRKNNGNWTDEEKSYYGQFKIKEIIVSNY